MHELAAERPQQVLDFVERMLSWVRGKGKVLIIIHDNPDPDCLASAMALRHLFVMALNKDATISFSGMIGRSENLTMAKELEITLTPLPIVNLDDYQVICMLDTQPGTGNNALPPERKVDILIDHHPMRETSRNCRFVDINEEYGATATMVYEYLQSQKISIGIKLATALFYAIKSETQDLGREANRPDRDAYLKLFPLTNKRLLYEIAYPKLPPDYFLTLSHAIENSKIYRNLVVASLGEVSFPEVVAEMCDLLLRLEGIEVALCYGYYGQEMILSIRTTREDLNAGEVIKRLVAGHGLAGGHGMMAGGKIDNVVTADAKRELAELLTERLLLELGLSGVSAAKLRPHDPLVDRDDKARL
ncbi:MAG TPA: DHH family phosphoesterase [Geobacterales bacterium]|nr:DHH family phosphoesterase [Geobacterales bacterium]